MAALLAAIRFNRSWPKGAVAQLGERLVRNEEVRGSIPLGSTSLRFASFGSADHDDTHWMRTTMDFHPKATAHRQATGEIRDHACFNPALPAVAVRA
jgi:hypothetical protein